MKIEITVPGVTLENVKIGEVLYGTIESGIPTDYLGIERAVEHNITLGPDDEVVGTVLLDGWGAHSWTLFVEGNIVQLTFTLLEDV